MSTATATESAERAHTLHRVTRIRRELYEAIQRRNVVLQANVGSVGQGLPDLERRIHGLWHDLRVSRAEALYRPKPQIIAIARAEERLERSIARTMRQGSRR